MDGWWAEAYAPELGWALGDGQEHGDDPAWDAAEAEALYGILEREVVPQFYTRDQSGIPTAWVERMRASMATLTPRFSAHRTVIEYTEQHYLTACGAYHSRADDHGAIGKKICASRLSLDQKWAKLRFGEVALATRGGQHFFDVEVFLDGLDPESVRVELYANASDVQSMKQVGLAPGPAGSFTYHAAVSAARPARDYTARLIPHCAGVAVPLEDARILWQR